MRRLTTEEFIERSRAIFGDKYDYSLVKYKTNKIKVDIICPIHGVFHQTPNIHLAGHGCLKCADARGGEKRRSTTDGFIARAEKIHHGKYDYSSVRYVNNHTLVDIICPTHGQFSQIPSAHLSGEGCCKCALEKSTKANLCTREEFINKAKKMHGERYDYSKLVYRGNSQRVEIICRQHGSFLQFPYCHISGNGCPRCKESRGERLVAKELDMRNIKYESQKRFPGLRNKLPLAFDFYLPDKNIVIEYNGQQHYVAVKLWGGVEQLNKTQERDKIKRDYCLKNGIQLIEIKYDENIEEKLTKYLQ